MVERAAETSCARPPAWRELINQVFRLAIPLFGSILVENSLSIVTFLRVGQILGTEELAATALGAMLCNASAFAMGFGLSTALTPTCAQAFGARNYARVGRQCQRMMLMLTFFCVPITLLWCFSAPLFRALGLPLSNMAETYTRSAAWGMWPAFMYDCTRRFLSSQGITWPTLASALSTIVLHVVISGRIVKLYGIRGAGWAAAIANWSLFLHIVVLAVFECRCRFRPVTKPSTAVAMVNTPAADSVCSAGDSASHTMTRPSHASCHQHLPLTWPTPFTRDVLREWGPLLRLGMPSALSLLIEWGTFELNAVIAGSVSIKALAVHSVFAQFSAIWYALPNGFAQAAATLGSNALGAKRPFVLNRLVFLAYICCITSGLLQGGIALALRSSFGGLFSRDPAVVEECARIAPILCICYELGDVFKCAGMVFLRETGRPGYCLAGVAFSSLIIGLPLSYWMGLHTSLGLWGIWLGMSVSWYVCGSAFVVLLCRTNWAAESQRAVVHTTDAGEATARPQFGEERPAPELCLVHATLGHTKVARL